MTVLLKPQWKFKTSVKSNDACYFDFKILIGLFDNIRAQVEIQLKILNSSYRPSLLNTLQTSFETAKQNAFSSLLSPIRCHALDGKEWCGCVRRMVGQGKLMKDFGGLLKHAFHRMQSRHLIVTWQCERLTVSKHA